MLKGFRDFMLRGNVVDVAVGIVIGVAFTTLVGTFTKAFIDPLVRLLSGGGVNAGTLTVRDVVFDYTAFVNGVITFILTAAVLYFLVVLPINKVRERFLRPGEPALEETELTLLKEIRDELRVRRSSEVFHRES